MTQRLPSSSFVQKNKYGMCNKNGNKNQQQFVCVKSNTLHSFGAKDTTEKNLKIRQL